jgi:hypothetical protein
VRARLAAVALALTLLGCASASQLARRSEKARLSGDAEHAYTLALQAREKDPMAPESRSAVDEAAWALYERSRSAIRARAAVGDTFEAANRVVDLDRLRERFSRDGVSPAQDPGFAAEEQAIREAGAARFYDLASRNLEEGRPKEAWRQFLAVRDLIRGFRDLDRMISRSWEAAVTPVAILPFADQAGMPEVSIALAREIHSEVERRLDASRFVFTRLIDPQQVLGRVSADEAQRIDRARAIALGRELGAKRVVWGRIWNLRADTDNDRWTESVWHQVAERDTGGGERITWVAVPFHAVARERVVHVDSEFEVLDTDREEPLDRRDRTWVATARTAFTDCRLDGASSEYRICPPSFERGRAESLEEHWKQSFGPWSLPQLVDESRRYPDRSGYRPDIGQEFAPEYGHGRVYLDDLPPAEELATLALGHVWEPVLESLALLDPR